MSSLPPLQATCCYMESVDGIGLLPCPPLQRLQVDASWVYFMPAKSSPVLDHVHPNSGATVSEQSAERAPFWQRITLRPSRGVRVHGPCAVPLRWLLDSHPAAQLVIQGSPTMGLFYMDPVLNEDEAAFRAQTKAMFRKRITS